MKVRFLIAGMLFVTLLSACTGATSPTAKAPITTPVPIPGKTVQALPTLTPITPDLRYTDPARTVAPSSGATLAMNPSVAARFADAAPAKIGRWEKIMDGKTSYVDQGGHGAVLIYRAAGIGDIQVSFFIIYNPYVPQYNTGDALDRFKLETSLIQVQKISVPIGEQAIISPDNRLKGQKEGVNPTVLAEMQWRNTVTIVYATPTLLSNAGFTFSADEAKEFLQKMYDAIPKP